MNWEISTTYSGVEIANKVDVINKLIQKNNYQSYLEIGIGNRTTFDKIKIKNKNGIDPRFTFLNNNIKLTDKFAIINDNNNSSIIQSITSDEFFSINKNFFDIIFIDGSYIEKQVDKDIDNSLKYLNENGTIIIDNCNPHIKTQSTNNWFFPNWNGTVWKAIVKLRCTTLSNIFISVVDINEGCGIIQKRYQDIYHHEVTLNDCLNWEYFNSNRKNILNLIDIWEFKEKYL